MAHRRIQILLDCLVVVGLGVQVVEEACRSLAPELVDVVAHLLSGGQDVLSELGHLTARDLVFLNGLLNVDLGLPFQIVELRFRFASH